MNPYLVVGAPNYAAPLLNFGSGAQQNQQGQNNQNNNNQSQSKQLGQQYGQLLQKLFGGGNNGGSYQPNGPMQLQGAPQFQGNPTQFGQIY